MIELNINTIYKRNVFIFHKILQTFYCEKMLEENKCLNGNDYEIFDRQILKQ